MFAFLYSHFCHAGTICNAFIICESKPEVASMHMQPGKRRRYNNRKLGLRYQGVLSSLASCVSTGVEAPVAPVFGARRPMSLSQGLLFCQIRIVNKEIADALWHSKPGVEHFVFNTGSFPVHSFEPAFRMPSSGSALVYRKTGESNIEGVVVLVKHSKRCKHCQLVPW